MEETIFLTVCLNFSNCTHKFCPYIFSFEKFLHCGPFGSLEVKKRKMPTKIQTGDLEFDGQTHRPQDKFELLSNYFVCLFFLIKSGCFLSLYIKKLKTKSIALQTLTTLHFVRQRKDCCGISQCFYYPQSRCLTRYQNIL